MAKVFSNFYGLKSSSTYSSLKCHFFLLTNFKDLEDFFIIKKGVNVGPRFLIKLYKIPTQKPKKLMGYKSQIIWWKINKRIDRNFGCNDRKHDQKPIVFGSTFEGAIKNRSLVARFSFYRWLKEFLYNFSSQILPKECEIYFLYKKSWNTWRNDQELLANPLDQLALVFCYIHSYCNWSSKVYLSCEGFIAWNSYM